MLPDGMLRWLIIAAAIAGGLCLLFAVTRVFFYKRDIRVTILEKRNPNTQQPVNPSYPSYAIDADCNGKVRTFYCDRNLYHQLPVGTPVTVTVKDVVIVGFHEDPKVNNIFEEP